MPAPSLTGTTSRSAPGRARGGRGAACARLVLIGLTCLLATCGGSARPGEPPRHVLLITVDTLRADHLSAWLYGRPTSFFQASEQERLAGADLSIDTLADQGVLFRKAFAPRGQTSPSVASLMTGLPPLEHGLSNNGEVLPESFATLAESFAAAGFDTAGFTANQLLVPPSGLTQGFATFDSFAGSDRDVEVVQAAMAWLGERDLDSGAPIFLWLHFMGPHLPYEPLPIGTMDFATRFTDPTYEGPANGSREFLDAAYADGTPLSGLDVNQVVALYDGEVARTAYVIKTFLQLYSGVYEDPPRKRLDDTLLVLAADHGEELYERNGYWAHSKSVYSSVLHVPLVIRHPKSLTGRRVVDEHVTLEDVMPTLLDWFELPEPEGLRGRSLLPLVDANDEREFESRPAFGVWRDKIFTIRRPKVSGLGDWRLVLNPEQIEPDEKPPGPYPIPALALYDLEADPREQRDVAAEHPTVVIELKAELEHWLSTLERAGETVVSEDLLEALDDLGY